ncbi:MAG: hypothetical protein WDN69_25655 [Aliidongia sp.]
MPRQLGMRVLFASVLGVAAFGLAAAADEPKPAPKAAPARPAGAHPPGAVPPGAHPPGGGPPGRPGVAPGARPGMPGPERGAFHGRPGGHGPVHVEFHDHDFHHFNAGEQRVWAGGSWHQDWHDGRYGWWWYTNGGWYFYDEPVYPMPLVVSDVYIRRSRRGRARADRTRSGLRRAPATAAPAAATRPAAPAILVLLRQPGRLLSLCPKLSVPVPASTGRRVVSLRAITPQWNRGQIAMAIWLRYHAPRFTP